MCEGDCGAIALHLKPTPRPAFPALSALSYVRQDEALPGHAV